MTTQEFVVTYECLRSCLTGWSKGCKCGDCSKLPNSHNYTCIVKKYSVQLDI